MYLLIYLLWSEVQHLYPQYRHTFCILAVAQYATKTTLWLKYIYKNVFVMFFLYFYGFVINMYD